MGKFPQEKEAKGSLKWTQFIANKHPELVNQFLRSACILPHNESISWLSPIDTDRFAEYRDQAFLDLLHVRLENRPLNTFWPALGPQWDALARFDHGEVFLVESKAHIGELLSPGTKASGRSRTLIDASLKETQSFLGVDTSIDWSRVLYQYTNRLAHLYLLRVLNRIPAFLVFLYFVGDKEMDGPSTPEEWKSATKIVKGVLGLRDTHKLSDFVLDVFINVEQI